MYTFSDRSDLRVAFSAWRVLRALSAEQILKPSLSKPSTLGTEYQTGLAPTSIPGPYSASNPGLGIGHVDDPPAADATHLLLSPVKSPSAAKHSDRHCCPFTGDVHGTLPLTVQGLGPRGVHLLCQHHTSVPIIPRCSHFAEGGPPPFQQSIPSPSFTRHTMDEHTNQDIQEYNNPAPTGAQSTRPPRRQRGARAQRRPTQTEILAGNVQALTQTVQVLMEAFRDTHNVQLPQRQPEAVESTPSRPPRSAS
ncbi:hypothetical protein TIFTF001_035162 [Ficus carica]|uniref:Uncharacterized protein n=1 Tax=Ficus carica TaxID=3494 RepID=A0AA88E1T8_FICCA|nr:hypothetical protein TIFTF001_035162 [Ficus carica]